MAADQGSRLDIDALRHPSEPSRLALAIIAASAVVALAVFFVTAIGGAGDLYGYVAALLVLLFIVWLMLQLWRVRLLADSVKVTAETLPEVDAALRSIRERLEYDKRVDVFIVDRVARVLGQPGPPIKLTSFFSVRVILAEGSALGDLDDPEDRSKLAFIFATYIGALKARQAQWTPVLAALQFTGLTKFVSWFIHPWLRATVYTGDRIAYAICDDLAVTVHAVYETLVGPGVAPHLRDEGLVHQAAAIRRNPVLRIAQLLRPVPHASNRYLQLLAFARQRSPDTFERFQGQLASSAVEMPPEVTRPPRSRGTAWLVPVAALSACALLATGLLVGVSAQESPVIAALGQTASTDPPEPSPNPDPEPEPQPKPEPEPEPIEPVPLSPDAVDASGSAPDGVDSSGESISFEPRNAVDGDPSTAWRVPGDGRADWITVAWTDPSP